MKSTYKAAIQFAAMLAVTMIAGSSFAGAIPQQSSEAAAVITAHAGEPAQAGVPRLVQFNGTLKDSAARPVAGVSSVTFAIYAEQDGGAALWSETQNVLADPNGHYNVLLGVATSNGVPADLFGTGQSRWLGVTIARQPEMARVLLASVPYALKAADADTLGGLPASEYVTTQELAASNARPATTLTTGGTVIATPQAAPSAAGEAAQGSITQAAVTGTGTTNYIPLWNSGSNLVNSILFQTASRIGVGTTTPVVTLDVNGDSIFRGSFQLVPQGTATASTGQLSHSYQWEASTYNSSTKAAVTTAYGFRATPVGNNTSNPTSSLDLYYGPGGGTLTDTGLSINNKGVITFASGQNFGGAELSLPNTTSSTNGVISLGGFPFLGNLGSTTNTFVGIDSGGTTESAGNAINNTGVGSYSLVNDTVGFNNTAVGSDALTFTTSGSYNTAIGVQALESTTTGGSNVAIGYYAGQGITTGGGNVFIGANAGANVGSVSDSVAIGTGATVSENGAIVLGGINPNASNVGIGTSAPGYSLEVDDHGSGKAGIAALSDIAGDNAIVALQGASSGGSNGGYFKTNDPAGSGVVGVNSGGGRAAYFAGTVEVAGNLQVDGTLSKMGGSFKIDDPIDPAGKYLSHSFVESPDMMNIYNGNVVLDAHGAAVVEMPKWFDALNKDFRYQLTAIGAPGPRLYVAQEIQNNRFKIAGGKAGMKVSWLVTGIRQDAWANAHRIPTEEEKPSSEQGRYLSPELFGAGPDKSVSAAQLGVQGTPKTRVGTAKGSE
jgi:trimeric autotransporter adhesin